MNETVEYVFAIIGMTAVIVGVVYGVVLAVVKFFSWKKITDGEIDRIFSKTGDQHLEIMNLKEENKCLWKAIDDINKRWLRNAEKEA